MVTSRRFHSSASRGLINTSMSTDVFEEVEWTEREKEEKKKKKLGRHERSGTWNVAKERVRGILKPGEGYSHRPLSYVCLAYLCRGEGSQGPWKR